MGIPPGLLEPATEARLARALAGLDAPRRLRLGALVPSETGIVEAVVRQVLPARPYARKRGGSGLLGKVLLADDSGEAHLLLWDDETRRLREDWCQPGAAVRIQGAAVRAGRGAPELTLGAAVVARLARPAEALADLSGTLLAVGPTRIVGAPPRIRFQADIQVQVDMLVAGQATNEARPAGAPRPDGADARPGADAGEGPVAALGAGAATGTAAVCNVVVEGPIVRELQGVLPGLRIRLAAVSPHPLLEGWFLAGPSTRLHRA